MHILICQWISFSGKVFQNGIYVHGHGQYLLAQWIYSYNLNDTCAYFILYASWQYIVNL